ncbi:MAG TPA: GNAT family N-acetyltransferase, partial [Polyangiaceae bacterium LLY-WYZ-15_(1-7)]|nr:GNAT family N-acetyltransferase [Polyangiaceae bacterium LLY-WYZ-15_(1-7)]
SVGGKAGWLPLHLAVYTDDDELVGGLPLYLKDHSYGEYIFDWGWADAAHRVGVEYYPKLVSMAPVTPATGKRLLAHPDADYDQVVRALVAGAFQVLEASDASSIHFLFVTEAERDALIRAGEALEVPGGLLPRLTMQFHWHNEGYADFDAYLARFRSSNRKKLRKERRKVGEAGLEVRVKSGAELTAADWEALRRFYRDTCARKGSFPYLTNRFFDLGPERLKDRAVAALAYPEGEDEPVAGTLNFEKGAHLYGRYWGCLEDHEMLHFELCYYALIERAIAQGMTRFEAGAQGTHKLRRGLMPAKIHSVHWLRDPRLRQAVAEFLPREAFSTQRQMDELAEHGPFKRGPDGGG